MRGSKKPRESLSAHGDCIVGSVEKSLSWHLFDAEKGRFIQLFPETIVSLACYPHSSIAG